MGSAKVHILGQFEALFPDAYLETEKFPKAVEVPLMNRWSIDEVPLEFSGTLNSTVAQTGDKRDHVIHPKVRFTDVRIASLMVTCSAAGVLGLPGFCLERTPTPLGGKDPMFKYKPLVDPRTALMAKGRADIDKYRRAYPNISIYLDPKSYFNSRGFFTYFQDFVATLPKDEPQLVIFDNCSTHVNSTMMAFCKEPKCEKQQNILHTTT